MITVGRVGRKKKGFLFKHIKYFKQYKQNLIFSIIFSLFVNWSFRPKKLGPGSRGYNAPDVI
jgi:hypothetical protein